MGRLCPSGPGLLPNTEAADPEVDYPILLIELDHDMPRCLSQAIDL